MTIITDDLGRRIYLSIKKEKTEIELLLQEIKHCLHNGQSYGKYYPDEILYCLIGLVEYLIKKGV